MQLPVSKGTIVAVLLVRLIAAFWPGVINWFTKHPELYVVIDGIIMFLVGAVAKKVVTTDKNNSTGVQMPKLSRQVEYSKELDEAMVFLVSIVKDVKAKKPIGEIATGNLQGLINAIAGAEMLDDEFVEDPSVALQTVGYRVGELAAALVSK